MAEGDLKKALKDTKQRLRELVDDVRETMNTIRPEESLLRKTRKTLTSPIRRRIQRRVGKQRIRNKKEE